MDEHTLKLLEFDKVRELLARLAPSSLGRERALAVEPIIDRSAIEAAQCLVGEMLEAIQLGSSPAFGEIADVRSLVRRARAEAMLSADNLREISATLIGLIRLREALTVHASQCPMLAAYALQIYDASPLAHDIDARIDQRGKIMDSASRELARLRSEIEKLEERIRALMQRLLRSDSIKRVLSYPNYTVTGSHYVLPVAKEHRHEVAGIVHRTSASGDTLFIEPSDVAEISTELSLLISHEQREVNRILRQLSSAVGRQGPPVLASLEAAADLCAVFAKAQLARKFNMVRPVFSDQGRLYLQDARHPLLEQLLCHETTSEPAAGPVHAPSVSHGPGEENLTQQLDASGAAQSTPALAPSSECAITEVTTSGDRATRDATSAASMRPRPLDAPLEPSRRVVPVTVHLGDRFDILVLTGPNTGGKTVALKTVGLLAMMAQAGMHIPAVEGSELPVFDQVLADIGDEQSIEQSLSTFSSHMTRIAGILKSATRNSLVLFDELGAGTDPAEGAALGRAVLDCLVETGVKAMVTTHLGDLKLYALSHARVENAAVEFDAETLRPTYHLQIGDSGQSCALIIARRLDLPAGVVDRAEQYLASSRAGRPQEIEVLERRRAEAESAREQAWSAEQEARRAKEAFEARLRDLDRQAADAMALEEFRAGLRPGDTVHVRKFRRTGTVQRIDKKRRSATISHGSMQWELPLEELEPVPASVNP